jgi:hypothetical protein
MVWSRRRHASHLFVGYDGEGLVARPMDRWRHEFIGPKIALDKRLAAFRIDHLSCSGRSRPLSTLPVVQFHDRAERRKYPNPTVQP